VRIDQPRADGYVADGAWSERSLRDFVADHAREQPDAPAFVSEHERCSWSEYRERAYELASLLSEIHPDPGRRVAVLLPDGPAVHIAYLATELAGLVAVGIGPRAGDHEIAHLMKKTDARSLVTRVAHRGRATSDLTSSLQSLGIELHHTVELDDPPTGPPRTLLDGTPIAQAQETALDEDLFAARALGPNDLFLLNSTSGTTGLPKCVTQFQNRWHYFHQLAVEAADLSADDRFMSVVPAPFGFGLWSAHFTPTYLAAPVVVPEQFTPELMIEMIERERVTVLACVSTQFVMMLNSESLDRHDLASLRVMFTGGEAVPRARAAEFEDRVGACLLQFYGSNETGALSYTTLRDSRDRRFDTAGRVIPAMHVRLYNEAGDEISDPGVPGQPACRGPATCAGYFDDPEANRSLYTKDGWMLMGDICTIDKDGYLAVVGRVSDFIIRGGKNISAVAVEQAVTTHPQVRMAAAVAMPDPVFGERVCVFVELEPGTGLTLAELIAHLRDRAVSPEWWPERLEVRDELPRSSGEKIAKGELRKEIEALQVRAEGSS